VKLAEKSRAPRTRDRYLRDFTHFTSLISHHSKWLSPAFGESVRHAAYRLGALGDLSFLPTYLYSYLLVIVLGGPLFEEIGWRGFALPRLEGLHGPALASLILGFLWALWHLPEFLVPRWSAESGGFSLTSIILFSLVTITFTITWVFNNTRASILLTILVHASIDTFSLTLGTIFPPKAVASAYPMIIGCGVFVVVIIIVTRGRLSYDRLVESQPAREIT